MASDCALHRLEPGRREPGVELGEIRLYCRIQPRQLLIEPAGQLLEHRDGLRGGTIVAALDRALQRGQLAHTGNYSITAAYNAAIAPGIRAGIGLGYTDNPTPVVFTPQTGSALNLLANVVVYW